MSTLERLAVLAAFFFLLTSCAQAPRETQNPRLGQPISAADIAPWDISIGPDGAGLPPGSGTARQGEPVYVAKCQACHGAKGAGKPNDALVGGFGTLAAGKAPVKTVGSYWPYSTTLFDYVRRAMPFQATKSLSADEIYAVSAYILSLNGIVGPDDVLDAQSLPRVRMPNRDGFVPFPRNPRE
jgi:cytochrome c